MRSLLLTLALLAVLPASAQESDTLVVAPGTALSTDWITPGTTTWTLKLVQPMKQDVGTSTETYSLDGDQVIRVSTVSIPMQGMNQTDSLRADAATLAPRFHRSTGGMMELSLEFMDEGVAGTAMPRNGETQTIMEMTETPVFDATWVGEIAQSLPLAEGLVARVPIFTVQGGVSDAILSVTGQEDVETADGTRTGWTVEMGLGPQTITSVIDVETRDVLLTRLAPQPGVLIEIVRAD